MKHLIISLFTISFCLLFSTNTQASFQSDVTNCLKINNSDDRLDCYDTVVKYYKLNPSSDRVHSKTLKTSSPVAIPSSPTVESVPVAPATIPEQNRTTKNSSIDNFGRAEAETKGAVESIQSRLIGQFSEWKKGAILKLENGQKWRVSSNGTGYKKINNPVITISRGLFGSFSAKVEGLNGGVKVKRVK